MSAINSNMRLDIFFSPSIIRHKTEENKSPTHLSYARPVLLLAQTDVLENGAGRLDGVAEALGRGVGRQNAVALLELGVDHAVGEALAADADALEHAVAVQLVHDQVGVQHAARLHLVGDDAAHEVGTRHLQRVHQLGQLLAVAGRDRLQAAAPLRLAALLVVVGAHVLVQERHQRVRLARLEECGHRRVYGVLQSSQ